MGSPVYRSVKVSGLGFAQEPILILNIEGAGIGAFVLSVPGPGVVNTDGAIRPPLTKSKTSASNRV